MVVYDYEKEDGLEEAISSNKSIAYVLDVVLNKEESQEKTIKAIAKEGYNANPKQMDLYYLKAILASVGVNKNDDHFTKEEIFKASASAEDKQVNLYHNEEQIIGHTTGTFLLDDEGNELKVEKIEDLPDSFNVGVCGVVYLAWSKESELAEKVTTLLTEIEEDKQKISMECLFSNFDYGCIKNGITKVIPRNKESAFLTKHLRAYGGTGEYQGYKLTRVLRDFTFSGFAFVGEKPANPKSIILKEEEEVTEDKEVESSKAELMENNDMTKETTQAEVKDNSALEATNKALASELENVKQLSSEKDVKITSLEDEVKKANERAVAAEQRAVEAEKAIALANAEKAKAERIQKLVEVGVDKVRAEELVNKFSSANDEMFAEVVVLNTKTTAAEVKKEAPAEVDPADKNADTSALDKATASDKQIVTTPNGKTETQAVSQAVAEWVSANSKFVNKS